MFSRGASLFFIFVDTHRTPTVFLLFIYFNLISEEHVFATRYGYGVIVDSSHVVWVKPWQVWGINRTDTAYAINFSREFYNVKEYGDFSENFSDDIENSMLGDFDKVVKIANEQAELRGTVEGQERASEMGFGFNF